MPVHHPTEALLHGYAAGTLSDSQDLVVATHLALCPTCRATTALLDAVGGAVLDGAPLAHVTNEDDQLAAIFGAPLQPTRAVRSTSTPFPGPGWMPQPLRGRVGPIDDERWQRLVPGIIQQVPLQTDLGVLRLVRMRPGAHVPEHGHRGGEFNLVLTGGFQDRGQSFARGDLSTADADTHHDLRVDDDGPCVILQVLDAPIVPHTWMGKVVGRLTGEG